MKLWKEINRLVTKMIIYAYWEGNFTGGYGIRSELEKEIEKKS